MTRLNPPTKRPTLMSGSIRAITREMFLSSRQASFPFNKIPLKMACPEASIIALCHEFMKPCFINCYCEALQFFFLSIPGICSYLFPEFCHAFEVIRRCCRWIFICRIMLDGRNTLTSFRITSVFPSRPIVPIMHIL